MPIYENADAQCFPQNSSPGKVDPGNKYLLYIFKGVFVSKIYSTYKVVNGNTGYSNHCDEQCDVDHGNNQVRPTLKLRKSMSFLRSPQTRAEFASLVSLPFFFHFVVSKRG